MVGVEKDGESGERWREWREMVGVERDGGRFTSSWFAGLFVGREFVAGRAGAVMPARQVDTTLRAGQVLAALINVNASAIIRSQPISSPAHAVIHDRVVDTQLTTAAITLSAFIDLYTESNSMRKFTEIEALVCPNLYTHCRLSRLSCLRSLSHRHTANYC